MRLVFLIFISFLILLIFSSCKAASRISVLEEEKELYDKMKAIL